VWELLIFIGIGGVGGLLGAGTVHLSKHLTLRRQSQTTTENAIEVCCSAVVIGCLCFDAVVGWLSFCHQLCL
jgi:hypothetical protein